MITMNMTLFVSSKIKCKQCKYEWKPRVEHPKECPNCKTRNWNIVT